MRSKLKMRARRIFLGILSLSFLLGSFSLSACTKQETDNKKAETSQITLGWMTSWATCGQLMQALSHTNIPKELKLPLVFKSFLFGPEINEAALQGEVNCTNSGLVPTISLLSRSDDWVVIGHLIDSPLSTVASNKSGISEFAALKGHTLAVPFGGGTHPYSLKRMKELALSAGEKPEQIHLVNLKPSEQPLALEQGRVEAIGTWEPQTTIVLEKKLGKVIDQEKHLGVITIKKSYAQAHPEEIVALLKAYFQANFYVAQHRRQCDQWYAQAAHLSPQTVAQIQVLEPNHKVKNLAEVNLDLDKEDLALSQTYVNVMHEAALIPKAFNFSERCDFSYLEKAKTELAGEKQ
jgi:ABC-type nitrate/sulfonate/bicarbonate transport system substrate-binding protein